MKRFDVETARQAILLVAGAYIVVLGAVELAKRLGAEPLEANELIETVTTVASLLVGSVIGFYLASRPRRS